MDARRSFRRIQRNRRNLIRNASTALLQFATNQIDMDAEQGKIIPESGAVVNSTRASLLLRNLRKQDLERTLDIVTQNVHLMLRGLNDCSNEVNRNICSNEILDLHAATVDLVPNAEYLGHGGNESDGDFSVRLFRNWYLVDFALS